MYSITTAISARPGAFLANSMPPTAILANQLEDMTILNPLPPTAASPSVPTDTMAIPAITPAGTVSIIHCRGPVSSPVPLDTSLKSMILKLSARTAMIPQQWATPATGATHLQFKPKSSTMEIKWSIQSICLTVSVPI